MLSFLCPWLFFVWVNLLSYCICKHKQERERRMYMSINLDQLKKAKNFEEIRNLIYREKELEYRVQDAKRHARNMGVNCKLTNDDYVTIAQTFIDEYDSNIAENDQFENIIKKYIETDHH